MKTLEKSLISIKTDISRMASIVMDMIRNSTEALFKRDIELAKKVFEIDNEVDELEVLIEKKSIETIALYEPKAGDLRFIITALRIIVDIERIGDLCAGIAKLALKLNELPQIKPYKDLPEMADKVINMLSDAISAYFLKNDKLAKDIIERDDEIDDLNYSINRELIEIVKESQDKSEGALYLMFVTKNLERIADHCTNIAELVIYMDTAQIVKHANIDDVKIS